MCIIFFWRYDDDDELLGRQCEATGGIAYAYCTLLSSYKWVRERQKNNTQLQMRELRQSRVTLNTQLNNSHFNCEALVMILSRLSMRAMGRQERRSRGLVCIRQISLPSTCVPTITNTRTPRRNAAACYTALAVPHVH